jgi:5'-nucleotidase
VEIERESSPNQDRIASRNQGPPIILVTNDDGIHASGIVALASAIQEARIGEVVVIAPDRDNSAVSHSITLHHPLRATEHRPGWWAIQGTPTDCVYLGAVELLPRWPSLVISGINSGPNLSLDVHYSGTVSAAIEGTILGIPSLAVSLAHPRRAEYGSAARFGAAIARSVLERGGLPAGVTLNVNVPEGDPQKYQLTFLGRRPYAHSVHKRTDPRGRSYYWIGGDPAQAEDLPGSDCTAVSQGIISVTPLMVDMSDHRMLSGFSPLDVKGWSSEPSASPPSRGRMELEK